MSQISNAEKQSRFRKKEHLKRRADNILKDWQWKNWFPEAKNIFNSKTLEEVKQSLDQAINLPSGWKDKDYEQAEKKLDQLRAEFFCGSDQLTHDIDAQFESTSWGPARFRENNMTNERARALANHLISALKLSSCNDVEQAAALMEALRFVGRSLASQNDVSCSQSTVVSLLSISCEYDRPEWFVKKLAEELHQQLGKDLAHELVLHLNK